ncbi:MAG: hypothetical protein LBF12_05925 [Christensenellaceae bacterium]|jgi:hypothetical protein|nr:hypothetical protein [Christensenellaceae bacterium]
MKQKSIAIVLLSLLASIMLSCNNDNDDDSKENRIPPAEESLLFYPVSLAANSQLFLSPSNPTREITLPIPVLNHTTQFELDCLIENVESNTNRLNYEVEYQKGHFEMGIFDPSTPTSGGGYIITAISDFVILHVYFRITLIGDEEFDFFEITSVNLILNYQKINIPVNIAIFDRRDYEIPNTNWSSSPYTFSHKLDENSTLSNMPTTAIHFNQKEKLISIQNLDGSPLKDIKIRTRNPNTSLESYLNLNGENSLNIYYQTVQYMSMYFSWDVDTYSGYISRELIIKCMVDDYEYYNTYFIEYRKPSNMQYLLVEIKTNTDKS